MKSLVKVVGAFALVLLPATLLAQEFEDENYFKVKEIINYFEGRILSQEFDKGTGQPRSLKALIPAAAFQSFCEELIHAALLQSLPPARPEKNREFVPVRIRFMSK